MTCTEFKTVHPDLDADARRHLDGCADCRAFVRSWELLGELSPIDPAPGFLGRLKKRLLPSRVRWLAPFGAVAAAVLAAVLVTRQPAVERPAPVTDAERELVENLEILENFELLTSLELVNDAYWPLQENGR